MTIELILLMLVSLFILLTFAGKSGPGEVFKSSGPRLGARIERQIATGRGFKVNDNGRTGPAIYRKPPGAAPDEKF